MLNENKKMLHCKPNPFQVRSLINRKEFLKQKKTTCQKAEQKCTN